ncbi:prepilin peptidase [Paenibacillus albidus]|uniref:prepilin peptidase n=1 Tax=Paenibacillus albidus TaxID=2041023 RepID=UPI00166F5BDB
MLLNQILTFGLLVLSCYCSYTDLLERKIPNKWTHPTIYILLLLRLLFSPEYLMGIIPAFVIFLIFIFSPGSIGAGDIKLVAILGLCMGLEQSLVALLFMCIFVFLYLGVRRLMSYTPTFSIPLAPFLCLGLFVVVV